MWEWPYYTECHYSTHFTYGSDGYKVIDRKELDRPLEPAAGKGGGEGGLGPLLSTTARAGYRLANECRPGARGGEGAGYILLTLRGERDIVRKRPALETNPRGKYPAAQLGLHASRSGKSAKGVAGILVNAMAMAPSDTGCCQVPGCYSSSGSGSVIGTARNQGS